MRDLGRSLDEILGLTYRQHEFFWERYMHQQQWEIHLQIKLNPWIEEDKKGGGASSENTQNFDWTTEEGMAALAASGVSVKTRRIKPKPAE